MEKRNIAVINKLGLHARAAAKLVTLASSFESEIRLCRDTQEVNGKSIMGVMMLAAARGTQLTMTAEGPDEINALDELEALFKNRFGESE
jgi:phosphocarrier protein